MLKPVPEGGGVMYETMAQPTHITACVIFLDLQCRAVQFTDNRERCGCAKARYLGSNPVDTHKDFQLIQNKKIDIFILNMLYHIRLTDHASLVGPTASLRN